MSIVVLVLLILLVLGFVFLWGKQGRTLFDIVVFIILLFLLVSQWLSKGVPELLALALTRYG